MNVSNACTISPNATSIPVNLNLNDTNLKDATIVDINTTRPMINIDGSVLEGGGQLLRIAIALSVLMHTPIKVTNIRAGRNKTGLRPQHLKGVELVSSICDAKTEGAALGSTTLVFHPGKEIKGGKYFCEMNTAGSITLLAQLLVPIGLFSNKYLVVDFRGGTNCPFAPHIDYTQHVIAGLLQKFGATMQLSLLKRGFNPTGQGRSLLAIIPVRQLKHVVLTQSGVVKTVWGSAFTSGRCPDFIGKKMVTSATDVLKKGLPNNMNKIEINHVIENSQTAFGTASGINLFADTWVGCIYGSSMLGSNKYPAENVGRDAANNLLKPIDDGVCVDSFAQDQLILFMALASGESEILTGPVTLHTKTAIYIAELMTKAKFTISEHGKGFVIACKGIGYFNRYMLSPEPSIVRPTFAQGMTPRESPEFD